MPLPNFLICGAHKAGTTSFYCCLRSHPDIFMSTLKEIHFFSENYEKGLDWYQKFFSGRKSERMIGEASTTYMSDSAVAQRIADDLPSAKLIFLLRNPTERAYSHYWYRIQVGLQNPRLSFSEIIRSEKGYNFYIKEGFYYQQIKNFLANFQKKQLCFIISEDFNNNPELEVLKCLRFLEVDSNINLDGSVQRNITQYPVNFFLFQALCYLWRPVKKKIWKFTPFAVKKGKIKAHKKLLSNGKKPLMKEKDRNYLRKIYQKPNGDLGEFLGRDLSFWK